MTYLIRGIDRETGAPLAPIVVNAVDEREALQEAMRQGLFTESIEIYNPISASPPSPTTTRGVRFVPPLMSFTIYTITGLVLCGLGFLSLFCFWPLGALLIVGGLIAPFYGMAVGMLRGPCPYCGYDILVQANQPGTNCSACKKRIDRIQDKGRASRGRSSARRSGPLRRRASGSPVRRRPALVPRDRPVHAGSPG